jgi:RNA polymerase sigma-70 factor (family 1)
MRADRKDIFKSRFQEHYSRLCRIAYGYVSDQDDAEDIVQELFISVWNKRLDDMPEKEFAAYMTTSVRNSCVSFLRKRKEDTVSIDDHSASASCMPDETPEEGKTLQDILDSALETLPSRCKDVFLLAKLQGLKYREIAEKLEVSEKTVENQMTKAIKLLRAYVAAHGALLVTVAAIILSIIINCE